MGYWVDERCAGLGYTPEAVVAVCRFAFEELGLHRLQIAIIPRNRSSRRVVEKLAIRDEGIAERVGLTGATIEEMYRIMALAAYEDRYVIPTTHREVEEDAYVLRGSSGFGFREGTTGNTRTNLFGGTKRTPRNPYMDVPT